MTGPLDGRLDVDEDGYTFHTPPSHWNDHDLIAALQHYERLIPNLYAAYEQLAAERDRRHTAYLSVHHALKDTT